MLELLQKMVKAGKKAPHAPSQLLDQHLELIGVSSTAAPTVSTIQDAEEFLQEMNSSADLYSQYREIRSSIGIMVSSGMKFNDRWKLLEKEATMELLLELCREHVADVGSDLIDEMEEYCQLMVNDGMLLVSAGKEAPKLCFWTALFESYTFEADFLADGEPHDRMYFLKKTPPKTPKRESDDSVDSDGLS